MQSATCNLLMPSQVKVQAVLSVAAHPAGMPEFLDQTSDVQLISKPRLFSRHQLRCMQTLGTFKHEEGPFRTCILPTQHGLLISTIPACSLDKRAAKPAASARMPPGATRRAGAAGSCEKLQAGTMAGHKAIANFQSNYRQVVASISKMWVHVIKVEKSWRTSRFSDKQHGAFDKHCSSPSILCIQAAHWPLPLLD